VSWTTSDDDPSTVDIELSSDGGSNWSPLASAVTDTGSWSWDTAPQTDGAAYRLRVRALDGGGNPSPWSSSVSDFELDNTAPSVTLTSPAGGELWAGTRFVTWNTVDAHPDTVSVDVSTDSGMSWSALAATRADTGTLMWDTTAHADASTCRIRVRATDGAGNPSPWSGTGSDLEIDNTAPSVSLTAPAGGEIWGGNKPVTWTTVDANPASVTLEVSDDSGGSWTTLTAVMDTGSHNWDTSGFPDGTTYRLRLQATDMAGNVSPPVVSASDFELDNTAPVVMLLSPTGGELWGGTQTITWNTTDANATWVDVEVSTNSGGAWSVHVAGAVDTGSLPWDTTTWSDGTATRVRVRATDAGGIPSTWSGSVDFTLDNTPPAVTITSPAGGEAYSGTRNVSWTTADLLPGTVDIEVSSNSGASWSVLVSGVADTGTWAWDTSAHTPGDAYRIRITASDLVGNTESPAPAGGDFFVLRYDWTRPMGGSSFDFVEDLAVDTTGNLYAVGRFAGTVDFRADWGGGADMKTSAGQSDVFVTKVNADGSYGWTRRIGGTQLDYGEGIAVDATGNVYLTGRFSQTVDFSADWGVAPDAKTSSGSYDVFVTKINADGSYGWTRRMGSFQDDGGCDIATNVSGAVYVTGSFRGSPDFRADWGGGMDVKVSSGQSDVFVTAINADGSYGWTRRWGSTGTDAGYGAAVDASGNVYVAGIFNATVDFSADWGVAPDSKISAGGYDASLTKINADGSYGWSRQIGGTGTDFGNAATVDGSGNVFVAGYFNNTVDFRADWGGGSDAKTSPGGNEAFVLRVNADGSYGWTHRIGGTGMDDLRSISADGSGNLFVTGTFQGTFDFRDDWGGPADSRTAAGSTDIFLSRINADGSYGWTRAAGGATADFGNAVVADGSGNVYAAGSFTGSVDFRADWGGTDVKSSTGGSAADAFVTRCR
jgi:hypothetical protein